MGAALHRVSGETGKRPALTGCRPQKARLVFNPSPVSISPRLSLINELAESLLAIVFPTSCSICGAEVRGVSSLGVCRDCWAGVESWEGTSCERCGGPIVSDRAADALHVLCGECRADLPDFDVARSFGLYRGNLRQLILQLKFRRRERLGRKLGALLEHVWNKLDGMDPAKPPVIVPVPLFHSRERERGFNQSRLLAEGLRNRIEKHPGGRKIVVDARLLVRTRATAPQVRLKFQARKENVRGAFAVAKPESVRGRSVLLVDDVMTTGATLSACAAALKKAGATKVIALTLARATPQFPDNGDTAQSAGVDEFNRHWT